MFHFLHSLLSCFFLLVALSSYSLAENYNLSGEDEEELSHLLNVLDKHTDIATKTKMNADYIPGMVTVLYGKDLEARGKRNIMEALTLVPGLDLNLGSDGTPSLVSRGIGSPYISATSMILLNGTPLNTTLFGFATGICNMPIEQIERIEIIRGPGAAVHGEFAYSGVINIITREQDSRVFATLGRNKSYAGGAMSHFDDKENDLHLAINGSMSQTDGQSHYSGPDYFGNSGNSNEQRESANIFATLKFKNFTLLSNYVDEGAGAFYSIHPIEDNHIATEHTYKNLEARHLFEIRADLDLQLKVGWQEYSYDVDQIRLAPAGAQVYITPLINYTYPDGMMMSISSTEEKLFTCLEGSWKGLDDHTLLAGLSYNHIELADVWQKMNLDPVSYAPTTWQKYSGDDIFVDKDSRRDLVSAIFQDVYKPTSEITITAGIRADHYSDSSDSYSPRLAGVWQPNNHHIFKAQAARAFRPPTFMELSGAENMLAGNEDIDSETIDTYEVGYIHRATSHTAKFTLFYSRLRDLIVVEATPDPNDPTLQYTNSNGARQRGCEFELESQISPSLKFDGNLSYASTKDMATKEEVVGSIQWLANAALVYQPTPWSSLACQYRFVDQRHRAENDSREDLGSYNKVDLTFSYFPAELEGLTLRVGVQNIFNEEILNASSSALSYADDFETQDRFWWAQCSYEF